MTVLDASALIALLVGEPAMAEVEAILRRRPPPSISAVNLAEVIDRLVRVGGRDPSAVQERIDWLICGGLEIEPAWLPVARRAASLRAEHYHRTEMPVSLADGICLATAITLGTDLATSDPVLTDLAGRLGVAVIGLPDSSGRRAPGRPV